MIFFYIRYNKKEERNLCFEYRYESLFDHNLSITLIKKSIITNLE